MAKEKVYAIPNVAAPSSPVIFNPEKCNGCNQCVETCQVDVYIPNPKKGKPPIIMHPEECWYCGCCVNDCHRPGAIEFNWALQHKGFWKDKKTGKISRM
jgi:NAD-dependent dihydropyrimidine dehydrogenase PreA subunit